MRGNVMVDADDDLIVAHSARGHYRLNYEPAKDLCASVGGLRKVECRKVKEHAI